MEEKALGYANAVGLVLGDCLGFGVDGSVWIMHGKAGVDARAVKLHRNKVAYACERDCYLRLAEVGLVHVRGLAIPQYLRHDSTWMTIEMTLVRPPFLVDFASATLDQPLEFDESIWADWEADREEKFGSCWPEVKRVLYELEDLGIYLSDVHPGNLVFAAPTSE